MSFIFDTDNILITNSSSSVLLNKSLVSNSNIIRANMLGIDNYSVNITNNNNSTIKPNSVLTTIDNVNAMWITIPHYIFSDIINTIDNTDNVLLSIPLNNNTSYTLTTTIICKSTTGLQISITMNSVYGKNTTSIVKSGSDNIINKNGDSSLMNINLRSSINTNTGNIDIICNGINDTNLSWNAFTQYIFV